MRDDIASTMASGTLSHKGIVARFEEFLEANPNTPLYLTDVCAAVGTAERTLRAACEEHLGMGPIRYLTFRRMHLVRRALVRADPATATVTQIAMDHGYGSSAASRLPTGNYLERHRRTPCDVRP